MPVISAQRIPVARNRWIAQGIHLGLGALHRVLHPGAPPPQPSLAPIAAAAEEVTHLLVLRLDGLGDLILSTGFFPALRQIFPRARLTLAVARWSVGLARLLPGIDTIVPLDAPWVVGGGAATWRTLADTVRDLRRRRFDLAFELRGDFRNILLMRALRARWRAGLAITGCDFALTHVAPVGDNHHSTCLIAALVNSLAPTRPFDLRPRLDLPPALRQAGRDCLRAHGFGEPAGGGRWVVLHPGARWPGRQWTIEGYAALADRLLAAGHRVVITGTPDEAATTAAVVARMQRSPLVLAGKTDFPTFLGILGTADLFVGVDSGPMHLASAIGTPVVALFGPAHPAMVGPRGPHDQTVFHGDRFPCSPCAQTVCAHPGRSCMTAITIDEVWAAVCRGLDRLPSPLRA